MDMVLARKVDEEAGGPWPLPEGWAWTQLGCLTTLIRGVSYTKDQASDLSLPTHRALVRGNNIQGGLISRTGLTYVAHVAVSEPQHLQESDIVLTMSSGSPSLIGKSAWVSQSDSDLTFGAFCACIRSSRTEDARWVYWYLQGSYYRRIVTNLAKGTSINNLKRDHLISLRIPLAPLTEQRHIVARVDGLFAEIAEGEAALAAARKGLDTFRRALLKAAVTGELTKDWREKNPATETGHDLLARIAKSRAAKGSPKGRGRRAAEARALDTFALPELPEGWAWGTLGAIGEIVGGATVDKKRRPSYPATVPYLRVANVQRGHVDLSEVKSITVERASAERLRLEAGDLLLNEGGDRDKIGRGWVWDGKIPEMIHQNHVFRVRLRDHGLNPFFVSHYANEMGRRFFIDEGKQTTNLASISLSKISLLPVPIPPPAEAAEILRRVSEALAASADTLAMLDAEAADAARLKQSILKAAFEGRLAPQDPADEPASDLLARLAANPTATRARRGRRPKS